MTPEERRAGFRALAATLQGVDLDAYADAGADPLEPVVGGGDVDARVCFFGRDPGRQEIVHRQPFVGAGGRKIRDRLHEAVHGGPCPDLAASIEVGRYAFWANTVPYKPIGNKAWSPKVVASFAPLVRDLLVHGWHGVDVVALGRTALDWFAVDRADRARLAAHWDADDGFTRPVEVVVVAPDGASRALRVHPLPHPSPLNATWSSRFPGLLEARLRAIGLTASTWRVPGPAVPPV